VLGDACHKVADFPNIDGEPSLFLSVKNGSLIVADGVFCSLAEPNPTLNRYDFRFAFFARVFRKKAWHIRLSAYANTNVYR
jgi:hypothetical protein